MIAPAKPIRCAVYCRKSVDKGLDQDFNSIDAQREACAAYITSQKASGWVHEETFEDGSLENGMRDDYFLREAYVWAGLFEGEWVEVKGGRLHVVSGSSFILDSFEPAASVLMDLRGRFDLPVQVRAWSSLVDDRNPYTSLQIDLPLCAVSVSHP